MPKFTMYSHRQDMMADTDEMMDDTRSYFGGAPDQEIPNIANMFLFHAGVRKSIDPASPRPGLIKSRNFDAESEHNFRNKTMTAFKQSGVQSNFTAEPI